MNDASNLSWTTLELNWWREVEGEKRGSGRFVTNGSVRLIFKVSEIIWFDGNERVDCNCGGGWRVHDSRRGLSFI